MSKGIRTLIVGIMLLSVVSLQAQQGIKKANKQYELKAFDLAITNYKAALLDDATNPMLYLKLADCYRYTGQYIEAIRSYEKVIKQEGQLPHSHSMEYAHTLKKVGLYDKAQKVYWDNKPFDPITSEHYALGCDFSKNLLSENERYEVSLFKFNSKQSDFGVSFFKDRIVFASYRDNSGSEESGAQLFIEKEDGSGMKKLRSPIKEQYGIGPLSYSRDQKLVAYSKNNIQDGFEHIYNDAKDFSIYYAITDDQGDFHNEEAFPFNSAEYANAFPNLSYNGSAMYFASTMPGGFGGFDIYVSYFKNGSWSKPENLGPTINTIGNEITPFFDGLNLYYSSNYSHGLGGFDIFSSKVVDGKWSFGENMGNGVNSPADDYYMMVMEGSGEMYYTSNRLGGKGNDDIYVAREYQIVEYASQEVQEENVFVPKALSLGDLAQVTSSPNKETNNDKIAVNLPIETKNEIRKEPTVIQVNDKTKIKLVEDVTEEKVIPNVNKKITETATEASAEVSLFGARKISLGEVYSNNNGVYFIQLAALSRSKGNIDRFRNLVQFGNLYKVYNTNFTKIKLGYYLDRQEASDVLNSVKSEGYGDAFLTFESMNSSSMELVASSYEQNDYQDNSFEYRSQSKYKVRLGAYSDPLWFDTKKVKDLGKIEQWSKGSWTIFVLSGFGNLEGAQSAQIQAINRGYADAEIVVDNNGILERLKQN